MEFGLNHAIICWLLPQCLQAVVVNLWLWLPQLLATTAPSVCMLKLHLHSILMEGRHLHRQGPPGRGSLYKQEVQADSVLGCVGFLQVVRGC